jgi:hypothetical protein
VSVYALLWQLVVHAAHGRGRDAVHLAVYYAEGADPASALVEEFTWEGDQDAFCMLIATDRSASGVV